MAHTTSYLGHDGRRRAVASSFRLWLGRDGGNLYQSLYVIQRIWHRYRRCYDSGLDGRPTIAIEYALSVIGHPRFRHIGCCGDSTGKVLPCANLPLVVIVLSCGFIFSGIRTVPQSLLQKELRFKLLAVIEGLQGLVQALFTFTLAFLGLGYWALVLGILSFTITPTILVLIWRRQSYSFPQFSSIRKAINYSRRIVIGRLCWASYNDSDFIIAGRVLGAPPLGAYTLAWTLAHTPLEKLTTLVNRVTPSVFAKIQTDPEALRRYLRGITGGLALIIFPATIGMALVAPEFVPFVLGPKWSGVIGPLQLLVLHALVRSNVILVEPLLNVIGEERLVMWNSIAVMIVLDLLLRR